MIIFVISHSDDRCTQLYAKTYTESLQTTTGQIVKKKESKRGKKKEEEKKKIIRA